MAQDPGRGPVSGQTDLSVNMSASASGSLGAEQSEPMDASVSMPGPSALINGGVTRKQNVACDACRAKKIKCLRTSLAEKVSDVHARRFPSVAVAPRPRVAISCGEANGRVPVRAMRGQGFGMHEPVHRAAAKQAEERAEAERWRARRKA
jgi:hypothetical protein